MYDIGQGVPQDFAKAVNWYRLAAEHGFGHALNNLGKMYEKGLGVARDYAEAATCYRRAAERGYAPAQFNLGIMYAAGQGVPQDYLRSYMWFTLAAERFPPGPYRDRADKSRAKVGKRITPAEMAQGQKMVREWNPKKD
jgi:TPR repeat protein